MKMPGLEDHLHDLADRVSAPATDAALQAVGRRTGVLRRRRQVRYAAGAGVLMVVVVAGGMALRGHRADIEAGPVASGRYGSDGSDGAVPALTVDLDGWELVRAEERPPDQVHVEDAAFEGALQVFHRRGDLVGPSVYLTHTPAADAAVGADVAAQSQTVDIAGAPGYLYSPGTDSYELSWNAVGDSVVSLRSWGLSEEEVLAFARGLQPKDGDGQIVYPPASEDQFGFVATDAPDGLVEVDLPPVIRTPSNARVVELAQDAATVQLQTWRGNERDFETDLGDLLRSTDQVEQLSVMDHTGVVFTLAEDETTVVTWRPDDTTVASLVATGVDPATLDDLLASVRELSEEEWQAASRSGG